MLTCSWPVAERLLLHCTGRLVVSLGRGVLESLVEVPTVKSHMPALLQILQEALQVCIPLMQAVVLKCSLLCLSMYLFCRVLIACALNGYVELIPFCLAGF